MLSLSPLLLTLAIAQLAESAGFVKLDVATNRNEPEGKIFDGSYLAVRADVDGALDVHVENEVNFYGIDLRIGSSQQPVILQLDTGSSDMWVNWYKNPYCAAMDNKNYNYDTGSESGNSDVISALSELGYTATTSSIVPPESGVGHRTIAAVDTKAKSGSFKVKTKTKTVKAPLVNANAKVTSEAVKAATNIKPATVVTVTATNLATSTVVIRSVVPTSTVTAQPVTSTATVISAPASPTSISSISTVHEAATHAQGGDYPSVTFDFKATATVNAPDWYVKEYYNCSQYGTYDYSDSDTFYTNGTDFSIKYVDGSYAKGVFAQDDVDVGGFTLSNVTFGVGITGTNDIGVLGISFPALESTPSKYANFPMLLKSQGAIDRVSYSLFLGSESVDESNVIFGGIDISKIGGGMLTTVPMVAAPSFGITDQAIAVTLDSITASGVQDEDGSIALASGYSTAYLDFGTTTGMMPEYIISSIAYTYRDVLKYSGALGGYVAQCTDLDGKTLTFDFQGLSIDIPLKSLMMKVVTTTREDSGLCKFGVGTSSGDDFLLGDMFLRNLYVVVDLENKQISLAPAVLRSTEEDIAAIPESGAIPSATSADDYTRTYGYSGTTALSLATVYDASAIQTTEILSTVLDDGFEPLATATA